MRRDAAHNLFKKKKNVNGPEGVSGGVTNVQRCWCLVRVGKSSESRKFNDNEICCADFVFFFF